MKKKEIRDRVIDTLIVRSTLNGGLQRSYIYKGKVDGKRSKQFRNSLSKHLISTMNSIMLKKNYSDNDHFETIKRFSENISLEYKDILLSRRLRIGTAQKLINLYWKMCWLLKANFIKPLHCPFDSVVIKNLGSSVKNIAWTKFDTIEEYRRLVEAAYKKDNSIADWELGFYINRINYDGADVNAL